ncbi:MAG: flagellar biosynthetic protein FliO [Phycisphaerae bacterium]
MAITRRVRLLLAALVGLVALSAVSADEPTTRAATGPSASTRPTASQPAASQPSGAAAETPSPKNSRKDPFDQDGGNGTGFADTGEMLWKMMASLMVLAVLAVAAWVVFRKVVPRIGQTSGRRVRLLETTYVGPRKAVHLLQVGRRRLLISSSREEVSLLADVTDAVEGEPSPGRQERSGNAS